MTRPATRLDLDVLGGVPFINDEFAVPQLSAAVVAVRQRHGRALGCDGLPAPTDFAAWLAPETAVQTRPDARPVPSSPVSEPMGGMIRDAAEGLAVLIPPWRPLLALPVHFHLLEVTDPSLSASTYLWPQHVLFSLSAFSGRQALRELLLHESCHQWLYLLEELWPLDVPDARRVALPSGTSERAPREVIGAAHVAAATVRMYSAGPHSRGSRERIDFFTEYGRGCLALLDGLDEDLTDTGRAVARHLQEAL